MKPQTESYQSQVRLYILLALVAVYFVRLVIAPQLAIDEPEQIRNMAHFSFGYPGNPPLPTWCIIIFYKIFNHVQNSLKLFQGVFLTLTLCLWAKIVETTFSGKERNIAFLAIFLFPTFWKVCFKFMPHTLMALFSSLLTYWWLTRCSTLKKPYWYSILGVCIALGLLSKFSYVIFLAVMILLAFADDSNSLFRLKSVWFFWSVFVAVTLASPYLFWILNHTKVALSHYYRLHKETALGVWGTPVAVIWGNIWVYCVAAIWLNGFKNAATTVKSFYSLYGLLLLLSLYITMILFGITYLTSVYLFPAAVFLLLFQKENLIHMANKRRLYIILVCATYLVIVISRYYK